MLHIDDKVKSRDLSLRGRLAGLIAGTVLPLALLLLAVLVHDYRIERERLAQSTVATARAMSSAVDHYLYEVRAGLVGLATARELLVTDMPRFRRKALELQAGLGVRNVVVVGPDRQQVLNTLVADGAPLPVEGDNPGRDKVFATGEWAVFDLFMGPVQKLWTSAVGIPLKDGDRVTHVAGVAITPDQLRTLLLAQKLPPGWIGAIIDGRGMVVARTVDHERFVGERVNDLLYRQMTASHENAFESVTLDGTRVLASFRRSPETNWTVAIGVPESEITAPLLRSVLLVLAMTVAVLAASVLVAWRFGDAIARSVDELRDAAARLGRGEEAPVAQMRLREAREVGEAMQQAARNLRSLQQDVVEGEARLKAVIESAMDAVIVLGADQRIRVFNPAASRMFGYGRDHVLGEKVDLLIPERHRSVHSKHIETFGAGSPEPRRMVPVGRVVTGRRHDGTEFPIDASISRGEAHDGVFYTVILRDVTEQVRINDALLKTNLDLQQFAFVASHDMRTPLRSVKGFLTLLERQYAPTLEARGVELVQRAGRAIEQLDRLTSDLLAFARLDSSPPPFHAVDLNTVLADVQVLMADAIAESAAQIDAARLPRVWGVASELTQLLQNLLGNAVKYHGEVAPRIAIRAERRGDEWLISVRDNGIGIDPRYHELVFQIFKRLHTQREYPGSGIGLATCKRIVERHRGRIWVESRQGGGSTFHFTLKDADTRHDEDA